MLQPPFRSKINQASATVPAAKIVCPITLSHFNENIPGREEIHLQGYDLTSVYTTFRSFSVTKFFRFRLKSIKNLKAEKGKIIIVVIRIINLRIRIIIIKRLLSSQLLLIY
jgi:hypothetical protein